MLFVLSPMNSQLRWSPGIAGEIGLLGTQVLRARLDKAESSIFEISERYEVDVVDRLAKNCPIADGRVMSVSNPVFRKRSCVTLIRRYFLAQQRLLLLLNSPKKVLQLTQVLPGNYISASERTSRSINSRVYTIFRSVRQVTLSAQSMNNRGFHTIIRCYNYQHYM